MSVGKKIGISILTVVGICCLAICFWYVYVLCFLPTKFVNYTFNVDKQTVAESDKFGNVTTYDKCFFEINIYDDFFEIVINSIWDEEENSFYSYCLQFYSNSNLTALNRTVYPIEIRNIGEIKKTPEPGRGLLLWKEYCTQFRNVIFGNVVYKDIYVSSYKGKSQGGEIYWQQDDNVLKEMSEPDFFFLIQIGNSDETELFGLRPIGTKIELDQNGEFYMGYSNSYADFEVGLGDTAFYYDYNFQSCDMNYILSYIFNSCKGLQAGTDEERPLVFGNYFEYLVNNGGGVYQNLLSSDSRYAKVDQTVKSAFATHVKKSAGKVDSAKNSLIGWLNGIENYGVSEENSFDYRTSAGLVNLTENDFHFEDNILVLNQSFIDFYTPYLNKIRLNLNFDMSKFILNGLNTIKINTGNFLVFKLNGVEINKQLDNYELEVKL